MAAASPPSPGAPPPLLALLPFCDHIRTLLQPRRTHRHSKNEQQRNTKNPGQVNLTGGASAILRSLAFLREFFFADRIAARRSPDAAVCIRYYQHPTQ